jgi:hypothetical protein
VGDPRVGQQPTHVVLDEGEIPPTTIDRVAIPAMSGAHSSSRDGKAVCSTRIRAANPPILAAAAMYPTIPAGAP